MYNGVDLMFLYKEHLSSLIDFLLTLIKMFCFPWLVHLSCHKTVNDYKIKIAI